MVDVLPKSQHQRRQATFSSALHHRLKRPPSAINIKSKFRVVLKDSVATICCRQLVPTTVSVVQDNTDIQDQPVIQQEQQHHHCSNHLLVHDRVIDGTNYTTNSIQMINRRYKLTHCCNMTATPHNYHKSLRQRNRFRNQSHQFLSRLTVLKYLPIMLFLVNQFSSILVQCQCPWPKEQIDLHSDCICDFNPPYNHLNRISIQCSPVNISQLIEALSSSASVPVAPKQLLPVSNDIVYELSSLAKIDLLHINNSTISRLTNNMFLLTADGGSSGGNNLNIDQQLTHLKLNNSFATTEINSNKFIMENFRVIAIQSLHISRSGIETIDDNAFMGLEPHLISLSLQDNLLTVIPYEALIRLNNLKVLDLSNNHIMQIKSNAFVRLNHLNTLRLADNKFYQIGSVSDQAFNGLERSLNDLNLKNTQLNTIPSSIRHLEKLAFLNLAQNQISSIPARMFAHMRSLTAINLERNRISSIDDDTFFGVESTLSSLSLLGNLIEKFPQNEISKLSRIRRLDMGFNSMNSIPNDTFSKNTMLNLVALDGNPLETLPESAFKTLNNTLLFLSIGGRSLVCDCRLSWVLKWQRDYKLQVTSRDRQPQFCSKPQYLRSLTSFSTLTMDHLACQSPNTQYRLDQATNLFARKQDITTNGRFNSNNNNNNNDSPSQSDNNILDSSLWQPSTTISIGGHNPPAPLQSSQQQQHQHTNLNGYRISLPDLTTASLASNSELTTPMSQPAINRILNKDQLNPLSDLIDLGTTESRSSLVASENQTFSYDYPFAMGPTTPNIMSVEEPLVASHTINHNIYNEIYNGLNSNQPQQSGWSPSTALFGQTATISDNAMVTLPFNTVAASSGQTDNQQQYTTTTMANNNQFGQRTSSTPPVVATNLTIQDLATMNPGNGNQDDSEAYINSDGESDLASPLSRETSLDDLLFNEGNQPLPSSNSRISNRHGYLHRHLSSGFGSSSSSSNSSVNYQNLLQSIQQSDILRRRSNSGNSHPFNSLMFGAKNSTSSTSSSSLSNSLTVSSTVAPPFTRHQIGSGTTKGPRLVADNQQQSHRYSISVSSSVSPPTSTNNQSGATQSSVTSSSLSTNFSPQRISSLNNQHKLQQQHQLLAASNDVPTIVPSPPTMISSTTPSSSSSSFNSRRSPPTSSPSNTSFSSTMPTISSTTTSAARILKSPSIWSDPTPTNNTRMSVSSIYRLANNSPVTTPNITLNGTFGNVRLLTPQRVARPPYMSLGMPSLTGLNDADSDKNNSFKQSNNQSTTIELPTHASNSVLVISPTIAPTESLSTTVATSSLPQHRVSTSSDILSKDDELYQTETSSQASQSNSFEAARTTPSLFFNNGNRRRTTSTTSTTTTSTTTPVPLLTTSREMIAVDNELAPIITIVNKSTTMDNQQLIRTNQLQLNNPSLPEHVINSNNATPIALSTTTTKLPKRLTATMTHPLTPDQVPVGPVFASTLPTESNAIILINKKPNQTAYTDSSNTVLISSTDIFNSTSSPNNIVHPRLHKQSTTQRNPSTRADDIQVVPSSNAGIELSSTNDNKFVNSSINKDNNNNNNNNNNNSNNHQSSIINHDPVGQNHQNNSTTARTNHHNTSTTLVTANTDVTQNHDDRDELGGHDQPNVHHDETDQDTGLGKGDNNDSNINLLSSLSDNNNLQENNQGVYNSSNNFTSGQFRFGLNRFGRLTDFDQMAVIVAGSLCIIIISIAMIFLCCCYRRWCLCCCLRTERRCASSLNGSSDNSSDTLHNLTSQIPSSKSMLLSSAIVNSNSALKQRNLLATLSGTALGIGSGHANEAYNHHNDNHQFFVDTLHKSSAGGTSKQNSKYNTNKKQIASLSASSANTIDKRLTLSTTTSAMAANELYPLDHENGIKNHKQALQMHQYSNQPQQYVYHRDSTMISKQPNYRIVDEDWFNDDDVTTGEAMSYCESVKSSPRQQHQISAHYDNNKCSSKPSNNNTSSGLLTTATSFVIPQADYYDSDRSATSSDRHLLANNFNDVNGKHDDNLDHHNRATNHHRHHHHHPKGIHRSRSMAAIGGLHDSMIFHGNYGLASEAPHYKSGYHINNNGTNHFYDFEHEKSTRYHYQHHNRDNVHNYNNYPTRHPTARSVIANDASLLDPKMQTMTMNRRLFPPTLNGRSNFHPRGLILQAGDELQPNDELQIHHATPIAATTKLSKSIQSKRYPTDTQQQYNDDNDYYSNNSNNNNNNNSNSGMPPPPLPKQLIQQQSATTPAANPTNSSSYFSQMNGYMVPSGGDRNLQYNHQSNNGPARMYTNSRSAGTSNYTPVSTQQQVSGTDMDVWSNDNQVDAMYIDSNGQQQTQMPTTNSNSTTGKYYLQPAAISGSAFGRQSGAQGHEHHQTNRYQE